VSQQYDKVMAERKVDVSREQLVEFIEGAFKEINIQQVKKGQLLIHLIFVGLILILTI